MYYHGLYSKVGKSRYRFEKALFNAKDELEVLKYQYEINTAFMKADKIGKSLL